MTDSTNSPQAINGESLNLTEHHIEQLKQLFPNVFTEGKIDFDALKAELGECVETESERYQFTWAGKEQAKRIASTPSLGTLRPAPDESVNWDSTENLYIEGDNLEVLKLLQKSYFGKVKMIYIDPPYNTGKDFVYKDDFKDNLANYQRLTGQKDDQGNPLTTNSESAGRYHSNWLNMMYPRLKLARNLLRDDGVIFISIDDNEVHNLRKICDEIFGEGNFLANIVWQKKYAATNDAKGFSNLHDHIIVYQKSIKFERYLLPRTIEQNKPYKHDDNDGRGLWRSDNLLVRSFSDSGVYPIVNPNTGEEFYPPEGSCWRASRDTMNVWLKENRIYFGKEGNGAPQLKRYLNEVQQGRVPNTWWTFDDVGHNDAANKELKSLFGSKAPFDTPKPSTLIKQMLKISSRNDDLVLDFFSGSATTAHAVMQLNAEDGGNRKFILVQIPEPTPENSEARKAGYATIAEIGKERIRRAGQKILAEQASTHASAHASRSHAPRGNADLPQTETTDRGSHAQHGNQTEAAQHGNQPELDIGFKVLKLDTSNIKKWQPNLDTLETDLLDAVDNILPDRTAEDLLYEVLIKYGLPLTLPIQKIDINSNGKTYQAWSVAHNSLVACFDENITLETVQAIANLSTPENPVLRVVFRDTSFTDDITKTNAIQRLKQTGIEDILSI
ncbi:MAG: site-specific DNA-methyltransferase [Thiomicrospira sp.]